METKIANQKLIHKHTDAKENFILELEFLEDDGETLDLLQSFKDPKSDSIDILKSV